jgi:hypothetical protein
MYVKTDPLIAAILYYDHAITFDEEYRYVWKNAHSSAAVLFLVNRYFALFSVSSMGNNRTPS